MLVWGLVGIAALLLIGVIFIYNGLIAKRAMSDNGWADIAVQLKRRADLIPQLLETVKAYASHEKNLFAEITEKRTLALSAGNDIKARSASETALSAPVGRLIALKEDYPDLKTAQNFLDLQNELSGTEDKIEMARRFYNGAVREQNIAVQSFPANLIAGIFNVNTRDFFEIDLSDSYVPTLDFKNSGDFEGSE